MNYNFTVSPVIPNFLPAQFSVSAEEAALTNMERGFDHEAKKLPPDQQEPFKAHMRWQIDQIRAKIPGMRKKGLLTPAILEELDGLHGQLIAKVYGFITVSACNRQRGLDEHAQMQDFLNRLYDLKVDFLPLHYPSESKAPDILDMIQTARKTQVEGNIATARLIALPGQVVVDVLVNGIKSECNQTPKKKAACAAVMDAVKASNQVIKETFPNVHQATVKLFTEPNIPLRQQLEADFGIPPDVSDQFARDSFMTALTVTPMPPVPAVFRFVGKVIPKVKPTPVPNVPIPTQSLLPVNPVKAKPKTTWGFLNGSLDEFGAEGSLRAVYKNSPNKPCTFFVNKIVAPDVEATTIRLADAAFSQIESVARGMNLSEAWVQMSSKMSGDLLVAQGTKRLEPLGLKHSIFSTQDTVQTFKLVFSKNPLPKGANFNEFERCYHRLKETLNTFSNPVSEQRYALSYLVCDFAHEIAPLVPNLKNSIAGLANPKGKLAPHYALVKSVTGREPKALSLISEGGASSKWRTVGRDQSLVIVQSDYQYAVDSYLGLHEMRSLKLTKGDVPRPVGLGRLGGDFYLAFTDIGDSILSLFDTKDIKQLEFALHELGAFTGEMHATNALKVSPGHPLHEHFVLSVMGKIAEIEHGCLGTPKVPFNFEQLRREFKALTDIHPVTVGYIQGRDLAAATWNASKQRAGYNDFEFFTYGFTVDRQVCEYPVKEYAHLLRDIRTEALEAGMDEAQITSLEAAFKKGSKSQHVGDHPDLEEFLYRMDRALIGAE